MQETRQMAPFLVLLYDHKAFLVVTLYRNNAEHVAVWQVFFGHSIRALVIAEYGEMGQNLGSKLLYWCFAVQTRYLSTFKAKVSL